MSDEQGWTPEQLETLKQDMLPKCRTKAEAEVNTLITSGYEFQLSGSSYIFDTSPDSLSKLAVAYSVAKMYQTNSQPYSQAMVMKDYQVIVMERDDIIAKYEAMIGYGLQLYSNHAGTIASFNAMDYYALHEWYDSH